MFFSSIFFLLYFIQNTKNFQQQLSPAFSFVFIGENLSTNVETFDLQSYVKQKERNSQA